MADDELPQITIDGSFVNKINEADVATKKLNTSVKELSNSTKEASSSGKALSDSQEDVAGSIKNTTDAADDSANSLNILSNAAANTSELIQSLKSNYDALVGGMQNTNAIADAQKNQFGLLNIGLLGVKEKFTGFENISTKGISLFKNESKTLIDSLKNDFLNGNLGNITSKITGLFGEGDFASGAKAAAAKGQTELQKYFDSFANGVDNAHRMGNAMIQLSASTGDLAHLQNVAGHDLQNLNAIIDQQSAQLTNLGTAYNIEGSVMEMYYSQIGQIPNALKEVISSSDEAHKNTSVFGAAIELASGSGRSFKSVVDDMHSAIRNFGSSNDQALTFVSRISEITNKYGLELEDVRSRLLSIGSSFKFFGNEAEGAAKLVNTYAKSIKDTGVSGQTALEIVGNMTNGIREMSLEQKAFLSAQTGGAGGLQGAFQIDKLFREDKMDEVFEKIKTAMKKQFGEIATLEEAASDKSAANRLAKQVSILKNGPLGKFAADDQSAYRILESFKKNETPELKAKDLGNSEESRNQLLDSGNKLLQEYNNSLSNTNRLIESQRQKSDRPAAEAARSALKISPDNIDLRQNIVSETNDFNNAMRDDGVFIDRQSERIQSSMGVVDKIKSNVVDTYQNVSGALKPTFNTVQPAPSMNEQLNQARQNAVNESSQNTKELKINKNTTDSLKININNTKPQNLSSTISMNMDLAKINSLPDSLKKSIESIKPDKSELSKPSQANSSELGKVMVDVSVRCVDCHSKLDHSQHSYAMGVNRTNQR